MKGSLKRKSTSSNTTSEASELKVYVLDHCLLIIKSKFFDNTENFKLYKKVSLRMQYVHVYWLLPYSLFLWLCWSLFCLITIKQHQPVDQVPSCLIIDPAQVHSIPQAQIQIFFLHHYFLILHLLPVLFPTSLRAKAAILSVLSIWVGKAQAPSHFLRPPWLAVVNGSIPLKATVIQLWLLLKYFVWQK